MAALCVAALSALGIGEDKWIHYKRAAAMVTLPPIGHLAVEMPQSLYHYYAVAGFTE